VGTLRAEGIGKRFPDGTDALVDVSFEARPGRVLALLGPSGCGKSTLLRIVAGLTPASAGRLTWDGTPFDTLPPAARDVGFVFQSYALYPHLSVRRNLSLALEAAGRGRDEIEERVRATAARLSIAELLERKPRQLSGGQQQRVALGRALCRRPRLYLMDEPLSNLDALLRETMRAELKALFRGLDATVLYVTHDQAEALGLADEVLVLKDGRVRQRGAPLEVYRRPADVFTATFVGSPRMTLWQRGPRWLGFRPEDVEVSETPLADGREGRLVLSEPLGDRVLLTIAVGAETLRALGPPREWPERVWVRVRPESVHSFDVATGTRLPEAGEQL
jgi:ABC-type sugar transport system ATPase subunit